MRTLYLLRHGKSSWSDASIRDFDRPLKDRGRKAAERVGKRLASEKLKAPLVICSPAVRARETAEIMLRS
jgi:phosphohistidine phosphatase